MEEVSSSTEIEPHLQPLAGEILQGKSANVQDDSRVDIRCTGFWNKHQDAFFDVRVFNPMASSNQNHNIKSTFLKHEKEKRRTYDQRIREVEHGSFTLLVFSAGGGMGPAATIAYKRLAAMLAKKRNINYSQMMQWLRSAIAAIRGTRSRCNQHHAIIDLALAEGHVPST